MDVPINTPKSYHHSKGGRCRLECGVLEYEKLQADVDSAIQEFEKADSGLKDTFKKAAGYVVFPKVGKGGFILGGDAR